MNFDFLGYSWSKIPFFFEFDLERGRGVRKDVNPLNFGGGVDDEEGLDVVLVYLKTGKFYHFWLDLDKTV